MKNSISITITALSGILAVIALFFALYNDSYLVLIVVLVTLILSTAVSVLITMLNKEDIYAPSYNINNFPDALSDNSWGVSYDPPWNHYGDTDHSSTFNSQVLPGMREEYDPFAANNEEAPDSHFDNQAFAVGREDNSTFVLEPEMKTVIINPLPEEEVFGELIAGDSERLVLSKVQTAIGRNGYCDINLKDLTISRRHAYLDIEYDVETKTFFLALTDLKSTNGTFVNGTRVIPDYKQRLQDKDIVKLGNFSLRYHQLDCFESVVKLLYISNHNRSAMFLHDSSW